VITKREARRIIRQAVKRVPEGEEIRHLNIMPMMDIMTILLVAFLMTAAASQALSVADVDLPSSLSSDPPPAGAVEVTIAKEAILVEGRPIVAVKDGKVDPSDKENGALGLVIPKLAQFLGATRLDYDQAMRDRGKEPPKLPELLIIGDGATPYKLLYEVIATSRVDAAGYRRFRLIVLDKGVK